MNPANEFAFWFQIFTITVFILGVYLFYKKQNESRARH
jgi:hypothetical protein